MRKSLIKGNVRAIWLAAILAILLSGVLCVTYYSMKESTVLDGIQYSKEECKRARSLMEQYYAEEPKTGFYSEELNLSEYILVLRQVQEGHIVIVRQKVYKDDMVQEVLNRYSYSLEQAESALKVLQLCERHLQRSQAYDYYVKKIRENLTEYHEVNLFSAGTKNLFVKANKDFYGLENLELRAGVDAGILEYLNGKVGWFVGMLFGVAAAVIFMMQFRGVDAGETLSLRQGSAIWWYFFAMIFGAVGIFIAEAAVVNVTWGLEELFRPLQSIERFRSCPEVFSVAAMVAIRIFFRCLAIITIFCLCVFLFSLKKRWLAALLGSLLVIAEIVLDQTKVPFTLYGQGFAENCFGSYRNFFLFDKPIYAGIIFSIVAVILFLISIIMAAYQIRGLRLESRERAERQYFEQVDEKYAQARLLRHDMNNHLSAVAMLLKEGKTADAQSYLEVVMEELDATRPPVRTGIGVLDAVLMGKDAKAKEKGIRLNMEFDPVLLKVGIPDYELCSLFGNLLDNCLEACEHLPEKDRWAHLKVTRQMDMICIFCENPYKELKKENGKIVSHKGDSVNHGFGIRQMERIATKHGGTLEIDTKDQIFAVSILFSMEI